MKKLNTFLSLTAGVLGKRCVGERVNDRDIYAIDLYQWKVIRKVLILIKRF